MRFSLRSTAFTMLALATVAANAAGVPQFYFSRSGDGDNNRLLQDAVTSVDWVNSYDVIVENVGDATLNFTGMNVLVAYARGLSQNAGTAPVAGTDTVTVFNTSDINNTGTNTNLSNIASWVNQAGGLDQVRFRGGAITPINNTVERPFGMVFNLPGSLGVSTPLAAGEKMRLATVKFKNNGFYANGTPFKDIFLYTAPAGAQTGSSTVVFTPGPVLPTNWEENSRLRLVPEPGTMLALVAGIGALAARRRRK